MQLDDQKYSQHTLYQVEHAGNAVQYLEAIRKRTVHHIGRQGLRFEIGHDRLDAKLDCQRDQQHHHHNPEQDLPNRISARQSDALDQQIRSTNHAEITHQSEHLSGQHARQLPIRLGIEQHGYGEIAYRPQAADPCGSQQRSEMMR